MADIKAWYEKAALKVANDVLATKVEINGETTTIEGALKKMEEIIPKFEKMLIARKEAGMQNKQNWRTGEDVYKWWIGEDIDQLTLFSDEEILEILYDMGGSMHRSLIRSDLND